MLQNRVFYGLVLAAAVLLYIFTNTYYTLTLLVLTILLPLISMGLMLLSGGGLNIRLETPDTASKDAVSVSYIFENTGSFPLARLTFLVQMENLMTGTKAFKEVHATVGRKTSVTAKLAIRGCKAGSLVLSTKKIRVCDAFGLFYLKKKELPERVLLVYPDMRDMAVHMEKPVETMGEGSRYSAERPGQDVSEIFTLREYTEGDEVRKIHWKLSSKIDKTLVRDFSLPLNYSLFLLAELHFEGENTADAVLELFCSLSRMLLESGINHSFAWYDAGEEEFCVRELDTLEDLDVAAARLLSSCACPKKGAALDYYAASGYYNSRSTLVYVAACPDPDRIAELEVLQPMRTICVYEDEEKTENGQAMREDDRILLVSVKEAEEGGLEIMV